MSAFISEKEAMTKNLKAITQMSEYRQWIFDSVSPFVGEKVLEAGSGTGNLSSYILQKPGLKHFVGIEKSQDFCEAWHREVQVPDGIKVEIHQGFLEGDKVKTLGEASFDSILCLNVLEHIEDDQALLSTFHTLMKPKGKLVLLVPAFQWLYGSIDKVVRHHRRYGKKDLREKMEKAGLQIKKMSFFNFLGIPAWVWHGKILKLNVHHETEMAAWDKCVPFLKKMESLIPPPMGLSLLAVGEKPE